MNSTRISCHINAPRSAVYRVLLDPRAIAQWKVPDGMTCHVHEFDAREGGLLRISLTYDAPSGTGKTVAPTFSPYMKGSRPVYRPLTTRLAGGWRSRNSQHSSRQSCARQARG